MKRRNRNSRFRLWLCALLLACTMQSCIKEDRSDCGLDIRFRYTYNMLDADAFGREADRVRLWVFDAGNRLVAHYDESGVRGTNGFSLHIPYLPEGNYSFVAWAGSTDEEGEYADFEIPQPADNGPKEALTARLPREEDGRTHRYPLNSLLNGTLDAHVSGEQQTLTIDMMKCTNTLRVILMPIQAGEALQAEDFAFSIEGKAGWLAHNAELLQEDPVTYRPYYQETSIDPSATGEAVESAVVAELNTSRLMVEAEPRLLIHDTKNDREIMNLNLAWFLSLQAIGEHRAEWSDQEYLDRQDEFAMTFFIDADQGTWMQTHIVVNGWVLSLEDVEL